MTKRILSVDIFRAVTMLLMIFVNDLWTLHGVPQWLEHTTANEDGMGLSDTVFPAFLFIVGLSIPFAIGSRITRGDSRYGILLHIRRRIQDMPTRSVQGCPTSEASSSAGPQQCLPYKKRPAQTGLQSRLPGRSRLAPSRTPFYFHSYSRSK